MSTPSLPDNVLVKVLGLLLRMHPRAFFRLDCSVQSWTFPHLRHSSLLLVSKQWYSVGAPLLYESIKITQSKHTTAIAEAFEKRPQLGKAVRYLRLDPCSSGLEEDLVKVAKFAPCIESLYIDVSRLKNTQSIAGLGDALWEMQLRQKIRNLYFHGSTPSSHAATDIVGWASKLVLDGIGTTESFHFMGMYAPFNGRMALRFSTSCLKEVSFCPEAMLDFIRCGEFHTLARICRNIKTIKVRGQNVDLNARISARLQQYDIPKEFAAKVKFERPVPDDNRETITRTSGKKRKEEHIQTTTSVSHDSSIRSPLRKKHRGAVVARRPLSIPNARLIATHA